jgi:hypothetical protein
MLPALQHNLYSQLFKDYRYVETVATKWLMSQDRIGYQLGTVKFIPLYDKCLSCGRKMAAMEWNYVSAVRVGRDNEQHKVCGV